MEPRTMTFSQVDRNVPSMPLTSIALIKNRVLYIRTHKQASVDTEPHETVVCIRSERNHFGEFVARHCDLETTNRPAGRFDATQRQQHSAHQSPKSMCSMRPVCRDSIKFDGCRSPSTSTRSSFREQHKRCLAFTQTKNISNHRHHSYEMCVCVCVCVMRCDAM